MEWTWMNYTVPSGNLTSPQTLVAHFGDDWPTWNMALFGYPPSLGAKEHLDPSSVAVHQSQQWAISTPLAAIRSEDLIFFMKQKVFFGVPRRFQGALDFIDDVSHMINPSFNRFQLFYFYKILEFAADTVYKCTKCIPRVS